MKCCVRSLTLRLLIQEPVFTMKPTYVVLFLFLGLVSSQREVPEQLKCFIKGFFKCKDSLRNLCSEFPNFEDRRPVPIPKNRLNGTCPILGQELPLTEIKYIDLPPCPCQEGNPVSKITAGYAMKKSALYGGFQLSLNFFK